jgi:hypothetical protein
MLIALLYTLERLMNYQDRLLLLHAVLSWHLGLGSLALTSNGIALELPSLQ